MFEHDRSAARGQTTTQGLYVFKHDSELGNAHAHALFDRLTVKANDPTTPARAFGAYVGDVRWRGAGNRTVDPGCAERYPVTKVLTTDLQGRIVTSPDTLFGKLRVVASRP